MNEYEMSQYELNEDIHQYPIKKNTAPSDVDGQPGLFINMRPNLLDMAVVVCHFNWCGFVNPVRNLNRFINQMDIDGIPVYGIELSLTDEFVTKNKPNWKHIKVKTENICFQKEPCINIVEKFVPEQYTKIAWIDTDLYFTNRNWYSEASQKLEEYKLVQLYTAGKDTDKFGKIISTTAGIMGNGGPRPERGFYGHPGGAWAARRDLWNNGGLYPYSLMGSGDTIFINTIFDVPLTNPTHDMNFLRYSEWKKKIQAYANNKDVTYLSGNFLHEWHGDKKERSYVYRNSILTKIDFDKSVSLDENGLLKIDNVPQGVYDDIMSYFMSRKEDGDVELITDVNDMAVVSVHFNWANFNSPVKNLHRFILDMESNNVPLYGVELSLSGKFETEKYANWIKIKVNRENVCFQKESCINMLEKILPEKYTKIAWIDHDIYFKNRQWYIEASNKLNHYKVIQLFSKEIFTDQFGREVDYINGLMSLGGPNAEIEARKYIGTPGAALAARRKLWKDGGGLFPYSFMGGGDSVFLYSMYANLTDPSMQRACGYHKKFKPYFDWKEVTTTYVNESCSYIDGEIVHYWHGEKKDRKYTQRHAISDNINWAKSLKIDKNGILEIYNADYRVYNDIYCYFKDRNEDG